MHFNPHLPPGITGLSLLGTKNSEETAYIAIRTYDRGYHSAPVVAAEFFHQAKQMGYLGYSE